MTTIQNELLYSFPPANWTVILFMNGENDLLEDMKELYDQLASVGSNIGLVNFVALFDGIGIDEKGIKVNECAKEKTNGHVQDGAPGLYYIRRYNKFSKETPLQTFPDFEDLTKPENLASILKIIRDRFPAKHYGFIYKGHGGQNPNINNAVYKFEVTTRQVNDQGKFETDEEITERMKKKFEVLDWQFDSLTELTSANGADHSGLIQVLFSKQGFSELSYAQLSQVLQEVFNEKEKKLAFVSLECCWGQLLENGYLFEKATDYLIASADEAPMFCIDYELFCSFLLRNSDIKPQELANAIVAMYYTTSYKDYLSSPEFKEIGISLTCVNTQKLPPVLERLERLCQHLTKHMDKHCRNVYEARLRCREYTYELNPADYGMYNIDFIWFLENLQWFNSRQKDDADDELHHLIADLIQQLDLYYIQSYLGNNYLPTEPGQAEMGGKGIAIVFPATRADFDNSLYQSGNEDFQQWPWQKLLQAYYPVQTQMIKKDFADRFSSNGKTPDELVQEIVQQEAKILWRATHPPVTT